MLQKRFSYRKNKENPNLYTPANMCNFSFQQTLSLIYEKLLINQQRKQILNRIGMEWNIQNNKTQKI